MCTPNKIPVKLIGSLLSGCLGILPYFAFTATYYSRGTGDWDVASTWSTVSCGGAAATTPPGTTDDAVICDGHTVTTTADKAIRNLTVNAGSTFNDGGNDPTVSGNLIVNGTIISTGRLQLTGVGTTIDGSGTFNTTDRVEICDNKTILSTADITFSGSCSFRVNCGTVTNNGKVTLDGTLEGIGTWTQGTNSTLKAGIAGADLSVTAFNASASGNTVNYYGSLAQNVRCPSAGTYHHLSISGTSTKTLTCALIVNGNLTINSGTLDMSGSNYKITIYGNWNNTGGTFVERNGTVEYAGTANTSITNSSAETFYNLEINKTSGGVTLATGTSLDITNTLTLTNGVITTSATDYFIHSNTTASNFLVSNGFVNGNLRRNIVSNTGTYDFPVSNGTASADKHRVSFVNNFLTGVSYLDVSVQDFTQNAPNNDANLSTTQSGTSILTTAGETAGQTVIWTITPNAVPTGGSYGLNLFVENTGLTAADDNKFCVLKRNTTTSYSNWDTNEGTTTIPASGAAGRIYNSGNGYAQRTGYTSFSQFSIGRGANPLPITLLYFDARLRENAVVLKWVTASEVNNDYFTVEKTKDAVTFEEVAFLKGAGNTSETRNYNFVDENPYESISYYRLKQTDFDGNFTYSELVPVENFKNKEMVFAVFPNPSDGTNINISMKRNSANEEVPVILMDINGKEIFSKIVKTDDAGFCITAIDIQKRLPAGIYMIASNQNVLQSGKLIIQHPK